MIKMEVIKQFTLKDYDKLSNIHRATTSNVDGLFVIGDTFECDENMVTYLTGGNMKGEMVAKVIEVEPVKKIEEVKEVIEEEPKVEKKNKKKKNK